MDGIERRLIERDARAGADVIGQRLKQILRERVCRLVLEHLAQHPEILRLGKGDPALGVNCGGDGPLSAEWMLPKSLWLKQSEPEVWAQAATVCECQDWMNFMLTGRLVAGGCNVATRWHCDGAAAVAGSDAAGRFAGRPLSLLQRVGLEDLADKWPRECVPMGGKVGGLTAAAAAHLGLLEGTAVAQGGADASRRLVRKARYPAEDAAPSARLVAPRARGSPTHPGAPPEQRASVAWPQELATGRPKAEDPSHFHGQGTWAWSGLAQRPSTPERTARTLDASHVRAASRRGYSRVTPCAPRLLGTARAPWG